MTDQPNTLSDTDRLAVALRRFVELAGDNAASLGMCILDALDEYDAGNAPPVPTIRNVSEAEYSGWKLAFNHANERIAELVKENAELKEAHSQLITVWKDGTWRVWTATDAHHAEQDPDWLVMIPLSEVPPASTVNNLTPEALSAYLPADHADNPQLAMGLQAAIGRVGALTARVKELEPFVEALEIADRAATRYQGEVKQLKAALSKLADEAERTYLAAIDDGADYPALKRAIARARLALPTTEGPK